MKRQRGPLTVLSAALAAGLLLCGALAGPARGGVPAAPAPGGAGPGAPGGALPTPVPPKKETIFDEEPDPGYEQGDRVDPFTLGKPKKEDENGDNGGDNGKKNGGAKPVRGYWPKKLKDLNEAYGRTELLLSSDRPDRFPKCVSECQRHLPVLRSDIRELRKVPEEAAKHLQDFQAVLEKFQRLETTAKRLQLRQEVEADFKSKKITVEGIVWRPDAPAAAVNGQMVTEGSVLQVGGAEGALIQVYRIRKKSVIFLYRGVEVSADLQRGSL